MHYVFRFVLAILAVWRITHLIAREDGPWDLILQLRRALEASRPRKPVGCFYCLSIWIALPFAWFLKGDAVETVIGWFALSAAAILLERLVREPVELKIEEEDRWDVAVKR